MVRYQVTASAENLAFYGVFWPTSLLEGPADPAPALPRDAGSAILRPWERLRTSQIENETSLPGARGDARGLWSDPPRLPRRRGSVHPARPRRHSDLVYRVALRILGPEEAKDASHEVWVRVWKALGGFRAESAFTTWIYKVTVNTCLSELRRERGRAERERDREIIADLGEQRAGDDPEAAALDRLVGLSGQILVALVTLVTGAMAAGWLSQLVARQANRAGLRGSNVFRRVIFVSVVAVASLLEPVLQS
jgi:hypothetical protein